MTFKERYQRAKQQLLQDGAICAQNRDLFQRFLDHQEYKLKRINGLAELDEAAYKTVSFYLTRLRTVNRWFENKPWVNLSEDDIRRVYDGVEDGRICTSAGKPYRGTEAYFRRIMKGKPFEMAGKREIAVAVMEFYRPKGGEEVRFIREETFRQLVEVMTKPEHKALFWLAWDIGENAHSLLQLRKRDFRRQVNPETAEPEYVINLRRQILKRSRTPRAESTNYRETVRFLDQLLLPLADDEVVFSFGKRMASKALDRAVAMTGARCIPGNQKVTLKDLRSSMACDLLSKGWTTDEVNYRLGHKPSSREIDKYVSWLALDRQRPKKRMFEGNIARLEQNLAESAHRERLASQRLREQEEQSEKMRRELERVRFELGKIKQMLLAAVPSVRGTTFGSVEVL